MFKHTINITFFVKLIFTVFCLLISLSSFAGEVDNLYSELVSLDRSGKVMRKSYLNIGERFYKIYSSAPTSRRSDEALLGSARTYRRAYERFKITEDLDKALRYYRVLQTAFDSAASKDAFLEAADIFKSRRDMASAKYTLNRLMTKYPSTSHAKIAAQRLSDIEAVSAGGVFSQPPQISNLPQTKPEPQDKPKAVTPAETTASRDNDERVATVKVESPSQTPSGVVMVRGIRYFSDKDYTRVVVDISESATYESRWLRADPSIKKPSRLSIDIDNSEIEKGAARSVNIKDGLLSAVRLGYHSADKRTRIVLDSENVKDFTVFQMSNPSRLVIDVYADDRGFAGTSDTKPQAPQVASVTPPRPKTSTPARSDPNSSITLGAALGLKIKTIVIDPGHGGKDPGAISNGVQEKDIVLDVSRNLRDLLKQDKSLTIYMTRDTDIFIPLEERTAIANKHKADIFISIHANSAGNKQAYGIETFVFNVTNDRAALEVAALENQATTKSISDLQGILKDILKYSKLEESLSLGGSVQNKLVGISKTNKNLGVKQAPFYVLVGATMPSILVEIGFISNADEAKKLKSPSYRKEIAQGIYKGLDDYISKYNK